MSNFLKDIRIKNKKSQLELAKVLGYKGKSGYSMLENGMVELTIKKATILANYYKMDLVDFITKIVQETWN